MGETPIDTSEILQAVLQGCGDCIKILDLAGRLRFMSENGKRVMEIDDFESLKGCPWPDFWTGEGNADARNAVEIARQGQTARFKGAAATAKGNPRHWDVRVSPVMGPSGKPTHLVSISRDITIEWNAGEALREAAERQRLLTEEMSHRVNNTFALMSAIAGQTIRGHDVGAAREAFIARLMSLAEANKILLQNDGTGGPITDVVEGSLAPHRSGMNRISVSGADFPLPPKQALSLALAIHELATNATKYGALANDTGTIDIHWDTAIIDGERIFVFRWRERGGPPVPDQKPVRKGFGSRIVNAVLAQDFGGKVLTSFEASGFVCELRSPFDVLAAPAAWTRATGSPAARPA